MSEFSFGDYGFGDAASAAKAPISQTDINMGSQTVAEGYAIINQFYNHASTYPSFKISSPIDVINFYMTNTTAPFDPNSFLDSLGTAAISAGMSSSDTDSAMQILANAGQGQIPTNPTSFFDYMTDQTTNPSLWSAAVYTVSQSVSQVGSGLQQTGQVLIDAGGIALQTASYAKYLIYLLPAVGLWWLFTNKESLSEAVTKKAIGAIEGNPRRSRLRATSGRVAPAVSGRNRRRSARLKAGR